MYSQRSTYHFSKIIKIKKKNKNGSSCLTEKQKQTKSTLSKEVPPTFENIRFL